MLLLASLSTKTAKMAGATQRFLKFQFLIVLRTDEIASGKKNVEVALDPFSFSL